MDDLTRHALKPLDDCNEPEFDRLCLYVVSLAITSDAHSLGCEDRVFLERPAGGNAKKLVATVLREGLSAR